MNISFLEGNKVNENQKGYLITKAFNYLRQVCIECQRLILKNDTQMDQEWKNIFGKRIKKDGLTKMLEEEKCIV